MRVRGIMHSEPNQTHGTDLPASEAEVRDVASSRKEQSRTCNPAWEKQKKELQDKTYREHLRALDDRIRQHGRKFTAEEEDELLRPPMVLDK